MRKFLILLFSISLLIAFESCKSQCNNLIVGKGCVVTNQALRGWFNLSTDYTDGYQWLHNDSILLDGKLRYTYGTPGTGKVLTSDSRGVVSWQTASGGGGNVKGSFNAKYIPFAIDNDSLADSRIFQDGRNIVFPVNTFITGADTSGSQINLNYGGISDRIFISTDRGAGLESFINMNNFNTSLGYGNHFLSVNNTYLSGVFSGTGATYGGLYFANSGVAQIGVFGLELINNSAGTANSNTVASPWAMFLNSKSSTCGTGFTNAVVLGGHNITANASNTAFVENLNFKRYITGSDTTKFQIDHSYGGNPNEYNISNDAGGGTKAWIYGSETTSQIGFGSTSSLTASNNQISTTNAQGGFSVSSDSTQLVHTANIGLKAPLTRVTGTFAVKDGTQAVNDVFTCTNASTGEGNWQPVSATALSGIVPAAKGGTGVNNSTRNLTISTNGGTLAFAAASSTFTIPATGTATLGTGTTNGFTKWTGTNTVGASTNLVDNGSTVRLGTATELTSANGTASKLIFGNNDQFYLEHTNGSNVFYIQAAGTTSEWTANDGTNPLQIQLKPVTNEINVGLAGVGIFNINGGLTTAATSTATFGGDAIFNANVTMSGVPPYADNAAAILGGLTAGQLYYTDVAGEYILKIAH